MGIDMGVQALLMDELEQALQSGSREKRIDTLRRITDLFLVAPSQLKSDQIAVFDDVLTHLIERVETKARAELAKRLAPVAQAPNDIIQRLARDDEIAVAGPVLTKSIRLSTADLVDIAQQKSQAHLLAIAGRDRLEEQLTDVLVDRGNRDVVHALTTNSGAAFSPLGYSALLKRADGDEALTERLVRRLDMPFQLFRDLLLRATEAVRARLLASVSEERQHVIRRVLAEVSDQINDETLVARDVKAAQVLIEMMQETGRLNESEIMTFAQNNKYEEVIVGIAALCAVPFELIDRLMHSDRSEALLVPCKTAGLRWSTVVSILGMRDARRSTSAHDIETLAEEFKKLSKPTAARVLRFWNVRLTTQAQMVGDGSLPNLTGD